MTNKCNAVRKWNLITNGNADATINLYSYKFAKKIKPDPCEIFEIRQRFCFLSCQRF